MNNKEMKKLIKTVALSRDDRKQILGATANLEKRYRQEASKLVDDLLAGWRGLGAR